MIKVRWIRQNEVNDIFEVTYENGEIDYIYYPRSMEVSAKELEEELNEDD